MSVIYRKSFLALCAVLLALVVLATPARAASSDPLFVFTPSPGVSSSPPPRGYFIGPCGVAVDSISRFYISDYYHHAIDVYSPFGDYSKTPTDGSTGYITQLAGLDPLDGPCGLALDGSDRLYVNNYHRNVLRFGTSPAFGAPAAIAGAGIDSTHPTGVAVDPATGTLYVDQSTYIAAYDSNGAPLMNGTSPLRIGLDPGADYYGLAFAAGRLYVADAATQKVKIFNSNPALDISNPVASVPGPPGGFNSLRDSALAVDRSSGELYVADNLQTTYTEQPQARIDVFGPAPLYAYEGHLKYNILDALQPGIAVDNSASLFQGRVYVTSGNTYQASVYAYPPDAATSASPLPPALTLGLRALGSGGGVLHSSLAGLDCAASCDAQVRSGAQVLLSATPAPGSSFAGWSGACTGADPHCAMTMQSAVDVSAAFTADLTAADSTPGAALPLTAQLRAQPRAARHRSRHRHQRRGRHRHFKHRRH